MFYTIALHLIENNGMEIDWGAVVAAVVAIGGLIGIYIKMHVSLAEIKVRQENQDKRIEVLEKMVNKQITVDEGIKEALTHLQVGQAALTEQIKALIDRIDKVEQ
jgi:predicted nuclease with TOPRIM domain